MGFTCGIVGLPNVGKSTIFNALTSAKANSANFPFCTIEPNTGAIAVPDPRLQKLSDIAKSEKIIPTQLTFVDIAGLIKGASKGEGLGNQFLGHIRTVDAIAHVVRCFDDPNIIHVEGSVEPCRDLDTIMTELIYADYEAVEKLLTKLQKASKTGDKSIEKVKIASEQLLAHLGQGLPASRLKEAMEVYNEFSSSAGLLTAKPALIVANVEEEQVKDAEKMRKGVFSGSKSDSIKQVYQYCQKNEYPLVIISGQVEAELSELSHDERALFLADSGIETSGLDQLALAGYSLLDLITFFTVGPKETHAWTVQKGTKAPQCAGKIHSDFEKNFIRAEVISYDDYVSAPGEVKAKELGKMRVEGKDYELVDGDIVHFRVGV
jgi:ribosome-binding ATPase